MGRAAAGVRLSRWSRTALASSWGGRARNMKRLNAGSEPVVYAVRETPPFQNTHRSPSQRRSPKCLILGLRVSTYVQMLELCFSGYFTAIASCYKPFLWCNQQKARLTNTKLFRIFFLQLLFYAVYEISRNKNSSSIASRVATLWLDGVAAQRLVFLNNFLWTESHLPSSCHWIQPLAIGFHE